MERDVPDRREGSTFGGVRGRIALTLGVTALAAGAAVIAVRTPDGYTSEGVVRIEASPPSEPVATTAQASAPVGARMVYELHGISLSGARPSALLAPHGAPPRSYRIGDTIGPGVVLVVVARSHVLLREGDARVRIDLPPRLGGSGEAVAPAERGLKPEPQPPTGELSGAQITASAPNRADPPSVLPGDEPTTHDQ